MLSPFHYSVLQVYKNSPVTSTEAGTDDDSFLVTFPVFSIVSLLSSGVNIGNCISLKKKIWFNFYTLLKFLFLKNMSISVPFFLEQSSQLLMSLYPTKNQLFIDCQHSQPYPQSQNKYFNNISCDSKPLQSMRQYYFPFFLFFKLMCLGGSMHISAGTWRGIRPPQQLRVIGAVSHLMWVLGIQVRYMP